MGKTALIIGATGLTGSFLINLLLESNAYDKVISFVRKDTGNKHPKLSEHIIDFDDELSYKQLVKGDQLFCCLGTTIKQAGSQEAFAKVDFDYPLGFAKLASANGVGEYFIISAINANSQSRTFYARTKGKLENRLKDLNFAVTRIFRPSLIVGNRGKFRLGEEALHIAMKLISPFLTGNRKKLRPIHAQDLAKGIYSFAQQSGIGYNIHESDSIAEAAKSLD